MNLSVQAVKEVKQRLEEELIKLLTAAMLIDDLKDRSDEYDRIKEEYYQPFAHTCNHLNVKLDSLENLKKEAADEIKKLEK